MISFKLILGVLFALMVTSIAVLSVLSYKKSEASIKTSALVSHSYTVLGRGEIISSLYKDIQQESNAFLVLHDSAAISLYQQAREAVFIALGDLRQLTSDNQRQQFTIDSLETVLYRLVSFSDSAFLPRSSMTIQKKIEINKSLRQSLRGLLDEIRKEEAGLLTIREAANKESITEFRNAFYLLSSVISVLLVATFLTVRYNFNKRISAQEQLERANDRFSRLFHETPIGIVISSLSSGVIIDCNKAYEKLINYSRNELIGKTAAQLKILESQERRNTIVNEVFERGFARDVEVELKPKGREPVWTSLYMQSIRINHDPCLLTVVLDITAHKRAEEEVKRALDSEIELNRMKSNFVTLASHEFRTPLTTILSSAFLIENYATGPNEEKTKKHLSRIKSSVNLLISILDEFLSLSKIEEGRLQPQPEMLDLKEYLESLCQNLQAFSKPGQKIEYHHEGPTHINMDKVLLGSIMNNLISNAIKYSPENSIIQVSSLVNNRIHLIVKDTGIGIPEKDQKNLFKRFYRASNAGQVQGTGLGLHILKHYVDLLHGSIAVESEPGRGSQFKIVFGHQHVNP
jgi:PAS domain S-box-containing protein